MIQRKRRQPLAYGKAVRGPTKNQARVTGSDRKRPSAAGKNCGQPKKKPASSSSLSSSLSSSEDSDDEGKPAKKEKPAVAVDKPSSSVKKNAQATKKNDCPDCPDKETNKGKQAGDKGRAKLAKKNQKVTSCEADKEDVWSQLGAATKKKKSH